MMSTPRKKPRWKRLLSFNQHRKRFGAKAVADTLSTHTDYDRLKTQILDGNTPAYTYGADKDLVHHIEHLRAEFAGQSALLHHHASLIVLIRREYQTIQHFRQFEALWQAETSYLLEHLNTRWLVSAADTFADHAGEPTVRSQALAVSLLFNTIKLQETERYLTQTNATEQHDSERLQTVQQQRVALFDGTSAFAVGTDDTLRNMRWRLDDIASDHPCGRILQTLFQRLQTHDTVYKRFRDQHTRKKTAWW